MIRLVSAALLFAAMLAGVGPAFAAQKPVFAATFEDGVPWQALPGVTTEVVTFAGRGRCLHLHGRQEAAWNYANSGNLDLTPGHKYRLSGWVKAVRVEPAIAPFFKAECVGDVSTRFATNAYDLASGGWQQLTAEFECPKGDHEAWVAVEKGVSSPIEIDAYVDEVAVMEIDHFSAGDRYRFTSLPAPLARMQGVHPRLYLTAERVAALKAKLNVEPYASLLKRLQRVADGLVEEGPPAYRADDRRSGEEQLYQREVGNAIPNLALTYVLTGERKYLESARAWMLASAGYATWGLGSIDGMDLAAGHQLYGLALGYDWLYHDLDKETLATVRECLARRGGRMYERLLSRQVWWQNSYLQNHQWVNVTGLAAAGLALYGEVEGVDGWVLLPLDKIRTTMKSLGPDGASHEGVPYWTYGVEYLLKFMDLARSSLGEDLFANNAWFQHTASFRLYTMLPRKWWTRGSDLMSFADGPRYDWYGPDYMLRRLAAEYRDGHAQWLADELSGAGLCGSAAIFLNLLWVDPSMAPQLPADLPTFKHFDDLDIVFMRSSWGGDEAMMAFRCGPHIGRHALAMYSYDPGGGHVHPDAGSILLFAHGDWLIVDDGYTWKTTAFQNTALVNGIGQEGEGEAWFQGERLCAEKRGAKVLRADHGPEYDYAIGDVAPAYKSEAGLRRFLRHILYLRPDCWVIVDELEAASLSTFELYFHGDFPFKPVGDRGFSLEGKNGALSLTVVAPATAAAESRRQQLVGTGGNPAGEIEALVIRNTQAQPRVLFVTVLEARPASRAPQIKAEIGERDGRQVLTLSSPARTWEFGLRPWQSDPASPALIAQSQ